MATEQSIERNYYDHEYVMCWPDRDDVACGYPKADLEALVASGKLKRLATLHCAEGHDVFGGSLEGAEAAERYCWQCGGSTGADQDPDDFAIDVRYCMTDSWVAALSRNVRECEHCGGTGRIFPPAPEGA
jgi:hypothetical protein